MIRMGRYNSPLHRGKIDTGSANLRYHPKRVFGLDTYNLACAVCCVSIQICSMNVCVPRSKLFGSSNHSSGAILRHAQPEKLLGQAGCSLWPRGGGLDLAFSQKKKIPVYTGLKGPPVDLLPIHVPSESYSK
jgi:hypothetical protein